MSGFPLYRFPIVVLRELFQQLTLAEIFNVSLCSKRSQRNVELLMRKGKSLEVQLDATDDSMISVQRKEEQFHLKVAEFSELIEKPGALIRVNINGTSVPMAMIGETLFLADKKSGLKNVTKHVLKVFRCQIQKANIGDSCSSFMPTWVTDLPIECLRVDAKNPSVKDVSNLFAKAQVSDKLTCSFYYASEEPRPAIKMGKMSLKRFDNDSSSWMTAEHLLNLNFEIGLFSKSSFRNRDMNRFLKHWMAGGCNRLQEVCIEMQGLIKYSEVLRDIDHELVSRDEVKEYYSKLYEDTMAIRGGFQIRRRSDGKVARLLDNGKQSEFFSFVVFEFESTIVAQFFGHDHLDYFTVFYEDMHNVTSKPIGVGYAAPSVTTFEYQNPAYRIYEIDSYDNFKIVDFTTYYADLESASETRKPVWEKLYSAREAYGMADLSPISWNAVTQKLFKSDKKREQFYK